MDVPGASLHAAHVEGSYRESVRLCTDASVFQGYGPDIGSRMRAAGMVLSVQQDSDERTFRLLGELDLATAGQLIERLEPAVRDDGDLWLDLAGLEFMDIAGIHALMKLRLDLSGRGRVLLRSPTGEVARVLELVQGMVSDRRSAPL